MNDAYDVIVIGAGMVGAAAAYRLADAGWRVLLIEAHEPASGASGNSFSWLNAVSKEPEAYHRLNADGLAEYAGLAEELGVEIGLRGGGSLQWGGSDDSQARMRDRTGRLAARGYPAAWISRAEALRLEPGLAIGEAVEGVAYHPGDGWVDAPRLARAFVNRTLAEGADLWRGARVRALRLDDGRVTGVDTDRGEVRAGQVLLCAGTGTPALLAPLGVQLPVRSVPGLLAVTSPVAEQLGRVVYAPGVHLRPDVDGGLRFGADDIDDLTSEITPAEPVPDFAQPLLERAQAVYPPARDARIVRVHIGVRPVPEDGLTVAGPVPGVGNAWVIVTHSGITMGPLLGRLIAEEMTGGPMDPRLAPFRPERFAASR
ncbi:MAG: NAD(P)/FAD-dependent oxidoreductase [Dehalococcoidia bacterium]